MPNVAGTEKLCQCAACGLYFSTPGVFDMHRIFTDEKKCIWEQRRCLTPAEMQAIGMGLNKSGVWVSALWKGAPLWANNEGEDDAA